jgi:hypothetical protein
MSRLRSVGLVKWLVAVGLSGCAMSALPPSEATITILRSYQNQLDSRAASGHLTRAQARDLLYAKLGEIQPPLPDLGNLLEFRKQVESQVGGELRVLEGRTLVVLFLWLYFLVTVTALQLYRRSLS